MPFPNEHACRLREPGDFKDGSFRRTTRKSDGKPYSVILGKLKDGDSDAMVEQAYRYPKDEWDAAAAKDHCQAHDGKLFEPAGESEKSADELETLEIELDELERADAAKGSQAGNKNLVLHKSYKGSVEIGEVKATDQGEVGTFRATFSTFDVVDRDRDVTEPGAISAGQQVKICGWGHAWNQIPIGKGVVGTDGTRAWVDGELFLDIPAAKDHYVALKNLGELTEWSYGFEVLEYALAERDGKTVRILKKLRVFEVSPVMVGAGINTRTDSIKSDSRILKFSDHSELIVSELQGYISRLESLQALRAKDGRVLSRANLDTVDSLIEMLEQGITRLRALRESASRDNADDGGKSASDSLRAKLNRERMRTHVLVSNIAKVRN